MTLASGDHYLQRRILDGGDPDSRAVDDFVHRSLLPQGRAEHVVEGHPEHVVPCAFIGRKAMELLRYGIPVDEVAHWLAFDGGARRDARGPDTL